MTRLSQQSLTVLPNLLKSNGAPAALQEIQRGKARPCRGLYLHIPFCFHKCHYCDFYSFVEPDRLGDSRHQALADALLKDVDKWLAITDLRPETIFVGGGTPTLLALEAWRSLLEGLRRRGLLDRVSEFTVEANPETLHPPLLDILMAGGVNRLSIGAQSFDKALLHTLERWHEPANVGRAVRWARQAGIDNLNLDLIFAIPGQTLDQLHADLDASLALEPDHLSIYNLTYEPNTALTQRLKMGQVNPLDEETERAMYAAVMERLDAAGFEHYELSNWARRGKADRRCRHNLIYWENANWLGLGPAAASHVEGWRWKNLPNLTRYLAQAPYPPITDEEHLPEAQRIGEALMMRLRLLEGVGLDWLEAHLPTGDPRHATIDELIDYGMLERTPTHLRLTSEGLFLADAVMERLL